MNKTLAITTIALVAVVMVVGTLAPAMAANPATEELGCPPDRGLGTWKLIRAGDDTQYENNKDKDLNKDGKLCAKDIRRGTVIIDNTVVLRENNRL